MSRHHSAAPKPVVLCILDGWGHRPETAGNAIALAHTPVWDELWRANPKGLLDTSGQAVGLPEGQMGNSEVGHMNIGAGRAVLQDLPRIDACITANELQTRPTFRTFVSKMKTSGGTVHLMGLLSPGGVHSHQNHMIALVHALSAEGLTICMHAFTDGRDTPPTSALAALERFLRETRDVPGLSLATVSGRYYAMDRDQRWERTEKAYAAIVTGQGEHAPNGHAALEASYAAGRTDEFVWPCVIGSYVGMAAQDGVICANFRADRARQLTQALLDPAFQIFSRPHAPACDTALAMTSYSERHDEWMNILFPPVALTDVLGEVVANAGRTQLRIAETEKYAHVTFFLNGGKEDIFPGEERQLIPSPKVATYDLHPEMSAPEITARLEEAIRSNTYDLIVANYANGDMVGHTGMIPAAIKAVETIDGALGKLAKAVRDVEGAMLITADHGNVEMMQNPETGEPYTQHTVGHVPIILVEGIPRHATLRDGCLADVAPTVLELMGVPCPVAMTGGSLLRDAPEPRLTFGYSEAHE